MDKIVMIGAGGHAKSIVDVIEKTGKYEIVGFVAPGIIGEKIYKDYEIIGHDEDLQTIYKNGVHNAILAVGFVGNSILRINLAATLKRCGYLLPTIIDPTAVQASDAEIGEGCFIGKCAVINSESVVEDFCIINTSAVVEHGCRVGSFTHVAVGAVLCGQVNTGKNVFIGSNATIIQGVKIKDNVIVGAGAVVAEDVDEVCTVVGVPAKKIKNNGV